MRKILTGFLGILVVVSVVGGSAYALFSANATVYGVAFSTGNAGLQFKADGMTDWASTMNFGGKLYAGWNEDLFPGYSKVLPFKVKNSSTSSISLSLKVWLSAASGDWSTLSSKANVWIGDSAGSVGSGYFTLAQWNGAARDLNITLTPGQEKAMAVYFNIPSTAGNEIAGKYVNTDWVMTGTQVTP